MNVAEKFRRFYSKLPANEQTDLYDLLALVRGPDTLTTATEQIKYSTVLKLRVLLFSESWSKMAPEATQPPLFTRREIHDECGLHFCGHVDAAVSVLRKEGINLELVKPGE